MNADALADNAVKYASLTLAKAGELHAMAIVHPIDNALPPVCLPYKTAPESESLERAAILLIANAAKEINQFGGLVLVSECWINTAKVGEKVTRPSEDPNRKEAVLIYVKGEDSKTRVDLYEIVRNGKRVLMGSKMKNPHGDKFESWLDAI